jgi:hypothetical protein
VTKITNQIDLKVAICKGKNMEFKKVIGNILFLIIGFVMLGCDSNYFNKDKKEKLGEKINVVCKGDFVFKNAVGLEVTSKTTDSYEFQINGDELIISFNGTTRAIKKNSYYSFENQPGKSSQFKNWTINEQVIEIVETLMNKGSEVSAEETNDDRLKIDRVSGKWSHDRTITKVDANKKVNDTQMYSFGICEKQEKKF